jgi:indolepyruvate ferredoxin oxidoreductase alpha subunit
MDAFKRALNFRGPAVIVSKSPCTLLDLQRKRKAGEKEFVFCINQEKCNQCKTCIDQFGCPAMYYEESGVIYIDEIQCNGCGNCVEVCPFGVIYKREGKK